jgi:tRNA/tmRNA/rRNA uracil-C5-methylase (TrmA/RlmC/RlmD family)
LQGLVAARLEDEVGARSTVGTMVGSRDGGQGQKARVVSNPPLLELEAGAIAAGGGCVARGDDGRVVFVRHCLPGERVLAAVTEETKSYLRADALEIIEASPDRVSPPCPYAGPGRCGGCDWQHVGIAAQRQLKADLVSEQLRRLSGIERAVEVAEVAGAPGGLGWRSRVRFAVDEHGRAGFHKHRSHEVVAVDSCLIASAAVEAFGIEGLEWPGVEELEVFASDATGEGVVSLSTHQRRLGRLPSIDAGLLVNGRVARAPERLAFEVLGHHYEVSAGVFWQVHPGATQVLGRAVLEELAAKRGDSVADLYAGAGLFARLLGDAVGPAGTVLAVERDRWACADAVRNTAHLPWVEVLRTPVTPALVSERLTGTDLAVLDPSREGAGRGVMACLAGLEPGPRRIAYVACDPASLARDLRVLLDADWTLHSLKAFDLFPMTYHVEVLAVLESPQVGAIKAL